MIHTLFNVFVLGEIKIKLNITSNNGELYLLCHVNLELIIKLSDRSASQEKSTLHHKCCFFFFCITIKCIFSCLQNQQSYVYDANDVYITLYPFSRVYPS